MASRNQEMFTAVFAALSEGAAIGIFPEGISHSQPSLADLKTGSARIALGHAVRNGVPLAVVPTGLLLRDKGRFRSAAIAVRGEPIAWTDLATRGEEDTEAVRELTRRIDEGLRQVTLNLDSWEDQPLVEGAQAIWAAEMGTYSDDEDALTRIQASASILSLVRSEADPQSMALAGEVAAHCRRLHRLGLEPGGLGARVDLTSALRWAASRVVWLGPLAAVLAASGFLLYLIPFHITGLVTRAARPPATQRSTYQILIGTVVYALWILLVALAVGHWFGIGWGLLALTLQPLIGITGMWIRERWRGYWSDMRRFFLIRSRLHLIQHLRERQGDLAGELDRLVRDWQEKH